MNPIGIANLLAAAAQDKARGKKPKSKKQAAAINAKKKGTPKLKSAPKPQPMTPPLPPPDGSQGGMPPQGGM